uniref:Succinate dehydrogenase cytochrome subunit 4 n=1 Tax=Cephalotaxus sinensis TaxID=89484 RepID=A0A8F4MG53_9CONI|nr:succinate dehydrogenase cytochrome subunit 4 [Cephalotaxus sinensis]BDG69796.1 succinate dehydrogenase cytochrome subunit 4 [Cephalotaxus harringtonia var. wilsoniana]
MVLAFRRRGLVIPICLYLLVGGSMKGRTSGLGNESCLYIERVGRGRTSGLGELSLTARLGDGDSIIESSARGNLPLYIYILVFAALLISELDEVYPTLLSDIYSFRHIHAGIEEIMADHVHQGMTRNWISILLGSFFFIVMKDVFPFPSRLFHHEWNNPMVDR